MPRVKPAKHNGWSRRIERNILSVYVRANEYDREDGLHWYSNAHETAKVLSDKYHISLEAAVGTIAALSPSRNWGINLLEAEDFIRAYTKGHRGKDLPIVGTYGYRNIRKTIAILKGNPPLDVLGGNKVRSFYSNILNPKGEDVTIDRHAKGLALRSNSVRGATLEKDAIVTNSEYPYYAKHYAKLAERLGLIPNQLQAICWVTWRRLKGNREQNDLPF